MPSSPLAPICAMEFSPSPALLQLLGAVAGTVLSPMTWIGTEAAVSPPIWTSAVRTAPQIYEDTNCSQSATALPLCCLAGRDAVNVDANRRSPDDPVSTQMWSIV